jgi:uncharacterized protein GlcG (DUF336 family)
MLRNNRLMAAGLAAGVFVLGLSIYNLSAQDRAAKQRQPAGEAARAGKGAAGQDEGREGARGARGEAAAGAHEHGEGETGGQAGPISTKDISLDQAHQVVEAAVRKSMEIGKKMDIAVVDAGGNLKAFARMDGAWLGSIDISIKKARTARFFDMNTGDIGQLSQPGQPLYQIEVSNGGLITFPGGVPIKDADGSIIGAIGVSGSSVEDDHTVASAGAEAAGAAGGGAAGAGDEMDEENAAEEAPVAEQQ